MMSFKVSAIVMHMSYLLTEANVYNNASHFPLTGCLILMMQILEPCKDSKVFRPPNPWITGILSLMAEIYGTDKLKLNLTFEIEMLFRNFNLQISDTRVSKELQNRKRDLTSGTDFAVDKTALEQSSELRNY